MANDPADQSANGREKPSGWSDVAGALEALGSSISHVAREAADDPDTRQRMRDLADGLAALARRVGETIDLTDAGPAASDVERAARRAGDALIDTASVAAQNVPPHVLEAIRTANAKFRDAAEAWGPAIPEHPEPVTNAEESAAPGAQSPVAPAMVLPEEPASVTGVIGAAIGERVAGMFGGASAQVPASPAQPGEPEEQSIHDWLFPEGEQLDVAGEEPPGSEPGPEGEAAEVAEAGEAPAPASGPEAPASPSPSSEPSIEPVVTPAPLAAIGGVDAARVAHERFLAERKLAEEAAEAARARAGGTRPKRSRRRQAPRPDDDTLW